ncbi:MAG: hypothetical protein ACNA7J_01050 [Wenzhouxiangella sp.]
MTILYSNAEAALLQAGALSRKLKHRYEQAVAELIGPGALADLLVQRAAEHEAMIGRLDKLASAKDFLPREADFEIEDLQKLADRFRSWVDEEAAEHLMQQFAEGERELAEELELARQDTEVGSTLDDHLDATRAAIERLPGAAGG